MRVHVGVAGMHVSRGRAMRGSVPCRCIDVVQAEMMGTRSKHGPSKHGCRWPVPMAGTPVRRASSVQQEECVSQGARVPCCFRCQSCITGCSFQTALLLCGLVRRCTRQRCCAQKQPAGAPAWLACSWNGGKVCRQPASQQCFLPTSQQSEARGICVVCTVLRLLRQGLHTGITVCTCQTPLAGHGSTP